MIIMRRIRVVHPVLIFCILNLLLSILAGLLLSFDYIPFQWLPGILAILLTILIRGKPDWYLLLKKMAIKTAHYKWYFISLVYPVIITLFAFCIGSCYINGGISFPEQTHSIPQYLLFLLAIIWGSIGEELGWRGFMLPLLNKRNSLLKSSLIVGLFWGLCHMYFFSGIYVFLIYFVLTCEFSLVISWIQSKVNGNIIPAIISHSSFNSCALFFFEGLFIEEDAYTLGLLYTVIVVLSIIPCLFIMKKEGILRTSQELKE